MQKTLLSVALWLLLLGTVTAQELGGGGSGSVSPSGAAKVDLEEVAGATVQTGHGTATGTLRVELPTDGTGQVGINQTTPGSTNGVAIAPSSASGVAITSVVAGSAVSSSVLKGSAGNLYGVYATCTSACWLMVFNATAAPSNGATTAGVGSGNLSDCVPIPASGIGGIGYRAGPAKRFSVGITAAISSTACATLTLSTVGFISGDVQ